MASPRKRDTEPPVPLAVRIVGRTAGVLALLGVAAFVAVLAIAIPGTAGRSGGMAEGFWKDFLLYVIVPIMGGSIILAILLALLNAVGIRPWFDEKTARFVRPSGAADWAVHLGGLLAGLLIPVTLLSVAAGLGIMYATGVDPDDMSGPLIAILIGGIGGAVGVSAIAGGIIVIGWFGVVAGLMLGAGFIGVVVGQTSANGAAWILGAIALAFAIATFYAGGRLRGTIPSSVGSYAASGGYFALGVSFFIDAALTGNPTMIVGGVAGVASTVGYIIGGAMQARKAQQSPIRA